MAPRRYLEAVPEYGRPLIEAPGLLRVVARNPGPMTYHGTNTWLVEGKGGWIVIDPGPDDPYHRQAVLDVCDGRIGAILVTHAHEDHDGGSVALSHMADAPLHGGRFGTPLTDGAVLHGVQVIDTPGHTMDHACFDLGNGCLLAGDHIMGWSTSVVMRAPHGSMAAYLESLMKVRSGEYGRIFGAHGPAVTEPDSFIDGLLSARRRKIEQMHALLTTEWQTDMALAVRLYPDLANALRPAATEMTVAMLEQAEAAGRVVRGPEGWKIS
ncbi:MBL fold metallo-hydrolase [Gluconacetobacter sp. Hr-1-5]|uniref:MBL fold metallo-hydrolase n=1 Tax=Gluconacetobacter sp. Hr-1-5 TaxID=3395370 RepID=UPI003B524A82